MGGGGFDASANPSSANEDGYDSYFSDDEDDISESTAEIEQTPSPKKTPMRNPYSTSAYSSSGKQGKAMVQSCVTGVHVSKKKLHLGE